MTPLSDLIAAIVARVIAHRQRGAAVEEAPVPENPENDRIAEYFREPDA